VEVSRICNDRAQSSHQRVLNMYTLHNYMRSILHVQLLYIVSLPSSIFFLSIITYLLRYEVTPRTYQLYSGYDL
jgi:hypothetical protein